MKRRSLFFIVCFVCCLVFGSEYKSNTPHPKAFPVLKREGYFLAYDGRNKIPLWTLEHLSKENVSGKESRQNKLNILFDNK